MNAQHDKTLTKDFRMGPTPPKRLRTDAFILPAGGSEPICEPNQRPLA